MASMPAAGAVVDYVHPGSIAADGGVQPGWRLLSINDREPQDIIDYHLAAVEEQVTLVFADAGGERTVLEVEKESEEGLGISFATPVFDGIHECRNRCPFCFVDQLPPGMRRSLYVRDDDYRLSFLYGNFITLSNLRPEEMERIIELGLSPLYISVHSTEPEVRVQLFKNKKNRDILPRLEELIEGGIELHTQIVITPGVNDGRHLQRTLDDLAGLYPGVRSIAIVPVGLTDHRTDLDVIKPVDRPLARQLVGVLEERQTAWLRELGSRLVYGADELYWLAEFPLPPAGYYEGFPQLENGVGMARLFMDELEDLRDRPPALRASSLRALLVTAVKPAPMVRELADLVSTQCGIGCEVAVVPNRFFGGSADVAGLLTGQDILKELAADIDFDIVYAPSAAWKDGYLLLDDMTVDDLARHLGCPVVTSCGSPRDLIEDIERRAGAATQSPGIAVCGANE